MAIASTESRLFRCIENKGTAHSLLHFPAFIAKGSDQTAQEHADDRNMLPRQSTCEKSLRCEAISSRLPRASKRSAKELLCSYSQDYKKWKRGELDVQDCCTSSLWTADILYTNELLGTKCVIYPQINWKTNPIPIQLFEARVIDNKSHALYGELGAFATSNIAAETLLGEYTGHVRVQKHLSASRYIMQLCTISLPANSGKRLTKGDSTDKARSMLDADAGSSITLEIDAERAGNETRFINDCRGIGTANVCFGVTPLPAPRVLVYALCDITAGQELLADYGAAYWDAYAKQKRAESPSD